MDIVETQLRRDPWDVDRRLNELGMQREALVRVSVAATSAAADSTLFDPANAAGTFSYIYGTRSLRDEFVGDDWVLDRSDAVESIRNDTNRVKVVFQNVDVSCDDEQNPKPRSRKGAGSERACSGNLFESPLPQFAPRESSDLATYYLMVDESGAAELTRPVVKGGKFVAYIERIYLCDGGAFGERDTIFDDDDAVDEFDPQVARR